MLSIFGPVKAVPVSGQECPSYQRWEVSGQGCPSHRAGLTPTTASGQACPWYQFCNGLL